MPYIRALAASASLVLAIAVAACTPSAVDFGTAPPAVEGVVVAVVDGDTIDVELDGGVIERVRLLGIDAPEVGRDGAASECFAEESRTLLDDLAYGEPVTLAADPSQDDADRYGRLLRYVDVVDVDAGLALLEAGAAAEYTYDAAYERQSSYRDAQTAAQSATVGMWQPSCL